MNSDNITDDNVTKEYQDNIVVFDGLCYVCSDSVAFIFKHDPKGIYKFTPLQSELGNKLLLENNLDPDNIETFLVIKNNQAFTRSDAALEIAKDLGGLWPAFYVFKLLPTSIRDFAYNTLARNRYRWFGKKDTCMIPGPELKSRFLD